MSKAPVIIAGGGIGGLTMALTLQQLGIPCQVFESASSMKPLGVGINIQPNAVRELIDLGIGTNELDTIGIPAREWALVGLNGKEVYAEPRGLDAGYRWPQYAVHRGKFLMLLYKKVLERLGEHAVRLDSRVTSYAINSDNKVDVTVLHGDGSESVMTGSLLIGADGIHSAVRAQMHPDQTPIHWGGALMWRGTIRAKPIRTSSSFIGLGTHEHRMVIYPISDTDKNGEAEINWIAELTVDNSEGWQSDSWFKPVSVEDFAHHFEQFRYDWLDVPAMLQQAEMAYENPMIDRDPVDTWVDGPVALMGDAAHPMYPTGSNGASQAIIDARLIGAKILEIGTNAAALSAYNEQLCEPVSALVLRNRGAGPFGLLNLLHERCGGEFNNIEEVIPAAEREEFMSVYKKAAGFAIESLNAAPPIINVAQS